MNTENQPRSSLKCYNSEAEASCMQHSILNLTFGGGGIKLYQL